jgi:hypothetical protein
LEIFKSDYYADVSLDQWLALTPPELVTAHLRNDPALIGALRKDKVPVVPALERRADRLLRASARRTPYAAMLPIRCPLPGNRGSRDATNTI